MLSNRISRRALALQIPAAALGWGLVGASDAAAGADGVSSSAESIHQEIKFTAGRQRVFDALTDAKRFDAVTRLSDALQLVTAPLAKPTSVSREPGATFTLFGGYITGRNIEVTADRLLVQAWRTTAWDAGEYSVVKFSLIEDGSGTQLVFDHRGFPAGDGAHLAEGWHTHYWEPLRRYLSGAP